MRDIFELKNTVNMLVKKFEELSQTVNKLEERLSVKRNDALIAQAAEIVAQSADVPAQLDSEDADASADTQTVSDDTVVAPPSPEDDNKEDA
uniref:Uncharacterized protein n=1 Tax=viral metagenome TaxID=1070528 RepID=A0A6C0KW45_9ZZZZ